MQNPNNKYNYGALGTNVEYADAKRIANPYTSPDEINKDIAKLNDATPQLVRIATLISAAESITMTQETKEIIEDTRRRLLRLQNQKDFLLAHLPHYSNYLILLFTIRNFANIEKYLNDLSETCGSIIRESKLLPPQSLKAKYSRASETYTTILYAKKKFSIVVQKYNNFIDNYADKIPQRNLQLLNKCFNAVNDIFPQADSIFLAMRSHLKFPKYTHPDSNIACTANNEDVTFNVQWQNDDFAL
jgi:hypothetical protein